MSLDIYPVNVIHITNPHLIYVEVSNPSDQLTYEQIGLYGILPLENTLDVEYDELMIKKSDTWVPASTKILRDICEENSELSFSPTYIDCRSTVFNDNIHKYGEVMIKSKNGKLRALSKMLIKRNLAYLNISEFHQKLSSGNLSTKLTYIKTQEIIKEIENYYSKKQNSNKNWAKAVEDQTSVFQLSQKLDSLLTVSNVEKHNNQMLKKILENKCRDFELCKEIDEDSVGCGIKQRSRLDNACAIRYRMAEHKLKKDQHINLNNIRKYLDANSKRKEDDRSEVSEQESMSSYDTMLNKRRHLYNLLQQAKQNPFEKETVKSLQQCDSDETFSVSSSKETYRKSLEDKKPIKGDHKQMYTSSSDSFEDVDLPSKSSNLITKKPQKYVNFKQIAYGPPELDRKKFKIELKSTDMLIPDNNSITEYKNLQVNENIVINNEHNIENAIINKNIRNKSLANVNFVKEKAIDNDRYDTISDDTSRDVVQHKSDSIETTKRINSVLQMKMKNLENYSKTTSSNSNISIKKSISNDSDEDIDEIIKTINAKYKTEQLDDKKNDNISESVENETEQMLHYNVNPFRNIDSSISVFVDKLVSPVLMVHTKINRRIQTIQNLQEVCFNKHIHEVLKRMKIHNPMMLQTVSWPIILRGYSLFMISPLNSGKTIGYLPAVCRLVSDSSPIIDSAGPISIIVCATAKLVAHVEKIAKQFLGLEDRVLACYAGVDELHVTTTLLNGCDLLISTPVFLYKLLQKTDFGVDLRRLSTLVLDDCERLFKIYANEVKYFQFKIKEMLKRRVQKELKVQYILASRVWCDSMESLAFKAPDTVICIGAFQECVMYSKTDVSISFIKKEPSLKLTYLQEFLQSINQSKKTVIVCATDDEVEWLEVSLKSPSQIIYATNNKMTVHDLYNLSVSWSECEVPLVGPILICCDGNLTHMNVTDAHNLVHFSLPRLFSMFSKRFSVLNNNYPSIFKNDSSNVKIKIFVEESNYEHLPKLISFIKRCTDVPDVLDEVCENILKEKDEFKAKNFVPICDSLLMLGYCPDLFHCHERHKILKEYDLPLEWLPEKGFVTFKLLHYHSAISYSGRILSNIGDENSIKYPQTYNMLSLKMGMYYSKEINRQLHGFPNVGDICAVAINASLYVRCQVVKILSTYERGNPNNVLIKLIDEEWYEVTRDIHLYYLPDELKSLETRVAQIRLVNITPKDNDITFSDLAKDHIKKIIDSEDELYLRAHIALTIGNCIFVDTLEVCQDLTSLNEVVVKHDIKHELLKNHAIPNENLLPHLKQLCIKSGLAPYVLTTVPLKQNCKDTGENIKTERNIESNDLSKNLSVSEKMESCNNEDLFKACDEEKNIKKLSDNDEVKQIIEKIPTQTVVEKYTQGKWSNFDGDDFIRVYIAASKNPDNFFTRLVDFESSMAVLLDEISAYVENIDNIHVNLREGEIVLAKYPDDATYERARIDEINKESVECFFLDQGDWIEIPISHLLPITEEIITKLPFQAIECRLLGVQPPDGGWTESTNKWFFDYCFEGKNSEIKILRTKYFTKTPSEYTGDFKYGVVLYDKNTDSGEEVLINQLLIDFDLALKNTEETQYFETFNDKIKEMEISDIKTVNNDTTIDVPATSTLLLQKPIRTMPLVDSDDSDDDKWDVVMDSDTVQNFVPMVKNIPIRQLPLTLENIEIERSNVKEVFRPIMEDEKQNVTETKDENKITKRPKLIWRQNLTTVFVSILIDVENYDLQIKDKGLKFSAELNNSRYEFDIELYGVIYKEKSSHDKKGLIISVKLAKINKIKWLELTRDHIKNWITYDVSADDISSEEEDEVDTKDLENYIKITRDENSDFEDDEFQDDLNR